MAQFVHLTWTVIEAEPYCHVLELVNDALV